MLGFIARFGSSKGMVAVPDLSGLTRSEAQDLISNTGLFFNGESSVSTSTSSLDGKISTQSISSGTLVDYGTGITFQYYFYIPPAAPTLVSVDRSSPCSIVSFSDEANCLPSYGVPNYTRVVTRTNFRQRTIVYLYSDGSTSSGIENCPSETFTLSSNNNSKSCGYVEATCTPSTSVLVPWGTCSAGYQTRTVRTIYSDCSYSDDLQARCCNTSVTCGLYGSWYYPAAQVRCKDRTCTDLRCNTYTDSLCESICATSTSKSCGACSKTKPFRRSCTTTTVNKDCSIDRSTASEAC